MKVRTRRNRFPLLPFGIHVIAGAVGVLAGIQYLLCSKDRPNKLALPMTPEPAHPAAERQNRFAIRRTKSELGYVYWVLQGFGQFQCYLLCDTWQEAMNEACLRIQNCGAEASEREAAALTF